LKFSDFSPEDSQKAFNFSVPSEAPTSWLNDLVKKDLDEYSPSVSFWSAQPLILLHSSALLG
jgi:hypothetical protein